MSGPGFASHPRTLSSEELEVLKRFCSRLIDQKEARVIVTPQVSAPRYIGSGAEEHGGVCGRNTLPRRAISQRR